MKYSVLSFGELLWDLLPSGKVLGGAPANFAMRVQELGADVRIASRLGDDQLGLEALKELSALGVSSEFIQRDGSNPTGTVDVRLSASGSPDYTINCGVAYDFIEPSTGLLEFSRTANLICFGTLVQRASRSRETLYHLLEEASPTAERFYDVNLRKDCFTADTVRRSLELCTILKLNDEEVPVIAELLSLPSSEPTEFLKDVLDRFSLNACLVTLGERGLVAGSKNGELVYVPGYEVRVKDSIGAGDACSAGFAVEYLRSGDLRAAGELGNAYGALVTSTRGGMSPVSLQEIEKLLTSGAPRTGTTSGALS